MVDGVLQLDIPMSEADAVRWRAFINLPSNKSALVSMFGLAEGVSRGVNFMELFMSNVLGSSVLYVVIDSATNAQLSTLYSLLGA